MPASQVEPWMEAFSRALGVECTHCHVRDRWEDDAKPQFAIARNMYRMVKDLNANQLAGLPGIICWSCHGGATSPSRIPRDRWQPLSEDWPADATDASDTRSETFVPWICCSREFRALGGGRVYNGVVRGRQNGHPG